MVKIFATTHPKNITSISFDRDLSVLSQKVLIIKFGQILTPRKSNSKRSPHVFLQISPQKFQNQNIFP